MNAIRTQSFYLVKLQTGAKAPGVIMNRRSRGKLEKSFNRFGLSVENGQAGAGQDGRTCRARLNSQARTGTGKCRLYLFSLP